MHVGAKKSDGYLRAEVTGSFEVSNRGAENCTWVL
jgi:hypothetical protein